MNPNVDFDDLVDAYLSGQADASQVQRLSEILLTDKAAQDVFLKRADLHACLALQPSLWQNKPRLDISEENPVLLANPASARPSSRNAASKNIIFFLSGLAAGIFVCLSYFPWRSSPSEKLDRGLGSQDIQLDLAAKLALISQAHAYSISSKDWVSQDDLPIDETSSEVETRVAYDPVTLDLCNALVSTIATSDAYQQAWEANRDSFRHHGNPDIAFGAELFIEHQHTRGSLPEKETFPLF